MVRRYVVRSAIRAFYKWSGEHGASKMYTIFEAYDTVCLFQKLIELLDRVAMGSDCRRIPRSQEGTKVSSEVGHRETASKVRSNPRSAFGDL